MSGGLCVSVVITAYNVEEYIRDAIESVWAQTSVPDEILVVDDGSTDGTAGIVGSMPSVRYVFQENAGPAAARNTAVREAKGNVIALLDGDDLWLPQKLEKQLRAIRNCSETALIFTQIENFHTPGMTAEEIRRAQAPMGPMAGYLPSALLVRKEAFARIGTFSTKLKFGDFIDWYTRAREAGLEEYIVPEVLVRRRLHRTNLNIRARAFQRDYLTVLRAKLKRQREQQSG